MAEQKAGSEKTWKVEYGHSLFPSVCQGCGSKTREWVRHVVIDYYDEDERCLLINLNAPWHYECHNQRCQHDFCVKQRIARQLANRIEKVVIALGDMIKTADVPEFLSRPHRELNGLSPLRMIWEHDEWGFERVMQIIEGIASGAFV